MARMRVFFSLVFHPIFAEIMILTVKYFYTVATLSSKTLSLCWSALSSSINTSTTTIRTIELIIIYGNVTIYM